jgi:hypothetical protein
MPSSRDSWWRREASGRAGDRKHKSRRR